ncbi:MAG: hypothetical protein RLY12_938, partial [Verrucomicrobiota bacterium]
LRVGEVQQAEGREGERGEAHEGNISLRLLMGNKKADLVVGLRYG